MGDRHGRVGREKQKRQGLSDDVRASHDDGALPLEIASVFLQKAHHARGRAGNEPLTTRHEGADRKGVKAVHVLVRIDRFDHAHGGEVRGKRELHENPVHLVVGVEFLDRLEKRRFVRVGGQSHFKRGDSRSIARTDLVSHVDAARRVVAHDDDRKARRVKGFFELLHPGRKLGFNLTGEGSSVQWVRAHGLSIQKKNEWTKS